MFDKITRAWDDFSLDEWKNNKNIKALLELASNAKTSVQELLDKFSEKDLPFELKTNKRPEMLLRITDEARKKLKECSEADWLSWRHNTEFKNFLDEEHGFLANLIHDSERSSFDRLKRNETLNIVLNLMGKTHASFTSFAEIPDRSFIVTKETCPRLYNLYREAHDKLELEKEYDLFCTMDYGRNAKTLGTDDECIIVVDSTCLEDFSDAQILALLGRELGHIKFKHVKYLTAFNLIDYLVSFLPNILSRFAEAAAVSAAKGLLLDWLLAAQFSADRAGAFVAGDILPVIQNNLMISGLETAEECIDFKRYIQINLPEDFNNFDSATKLLMTSTLQDFPIPFVIPRIKELAKWKASDECQNHFPEIYNANLVEKSKSVALCKGQRFELTKNNPQLRNVTFKFEWEQTNTDIEHGAFLLNEHNKVERDEDFVFYNNPSHSSKSVLLLSRKDNSARLKVDLEKIPDSVKKITLALMIVDADKYGQNFSMIGRVSLNLSDEHEELSTFSLKNFTIETVIVLGELYRNKGEWKFKAIGSGFSGGLISLCQQFGIAVRD